MTHSAKKISVPCCPRPLLSGRFITDLNILFGKSCVLSSVTKQLAADYVGGNSFRKLYRVHCSVVVSLSTINILFIRFFRIDNERICGILCASKGQIPFLFATLQWHVEPCCNEEH